MSDDADIRELRTNVRNMQLAAMRNDTELTALRELVKLQAAQILELQKVIIRGARVKP